MVVRLIRIKLLLYFWKMTFKKRNIVLVMTQNMQ